MDKEIKSNANMKKYIDNYLGEARKEAYKQYKKN